MAKVEITPRAAADVDDILTYPHAQADRSVVKDQAAAFKAATRTLIDHPALGRRRTEIGVRIRLVTVRPYVILYRYERATDMVVVLRVLHGRRRLALDAP